MSIFRNPTALAFTLAVNTITHLPEITTAIKHIIADRQADNWYSLGDDVADLMVQVIGKIKKIGDKYEW